MKQFVAEHERDPKGDLEFIDRLIKTPALGKPSTIQAISKLVCDDD